MRRFLGGLGRRVRFDAETRPWPIKRKSRRSIVKVDG
jgi:hypothetical protein